MIRTPGLLLLMLVIGSTSTSAQGTKDQPSGTQAGTAGRGVQTNSAPDSMGGAFKGTGLPRYGTSPGMGSQKKTRN